MDEIERKVIEIRMYLNICESHKIHVSRVYIMSFIYLRF